MEQETIGVQEMAKRLGVTSASIYNYIEQGIIRGTKVPRGLSHRIVVLRADFEETVARWPHGIAQSGTLRRNSEDRQNPNRIPVFTT